VVPLAAVALHQTTTALHLTNTMPPLHRHIPVHRHVASLRRPPQIATAPSAPLLELSFEPAASPQTRQSAQERAEASGVEAVRATANPII
jgi:hypothetical protein